LQRETSEAPGVPGASSWIDSVPSASLS
jgi:hypothetical protein